MEYYSRKIISSPLMAKKNTLRVNLMSQYIFSVLQDDKQSGKIEVIGGDNLENLKGKVIKALSVSVIVIHKNKTKQNISELINYN
jgi:hypothetical protein